MKKNIVNIWKEVRKYSNKDLYITIDKENKVAFIREIGSDKVVRVINI